MKLPRYVGLIDLGVAAVVLVTVVLPPREMYASAAQKGSDADRFAVALAEARTMAHPDDGATVDDLSRRLGLANFKDWAVEVGLRGSERAKQSPTRWRALLSTSVAYVDRLDVVPGLDYANRALGECESHQQTCPSWEQIRMKLYQQHLDAGVKSGIDPRHDPKGFRRAGEAALRSIRIGGERAGSADPTPTPTPTPTPAPAGSGSATKP
jgi:hypothetical protein